MTSPQNLEAKIRSQIAKARTQFDAGEIHTAWDLLEPVLQRKTVPAELLTAVNFLRLGCAVYYVGDLDAANKLNATLPITKGELPVRYRLALRQRQWRTAKWLRTSKVALNDPDGRFAADFRCSAALWCLWNGRTSWGLALYHNRANAIMFPQIMPSSLVYVPLSDSPDQDHPRIVLEQGIGDILLYLGHIRQQGHHARSTFIGQSKLAPLVKRWFPEAQFIAFGAFPESLKGQPCHAGADFLQRSHKANGSFALQHPLPDSPTRGPLDTPVFGLCWRGGSGQNRREERHIPLSYMLDMLPEDARFLALQFDITDDEKAMLRADGRVMVPFADITSRTDTMMDMVRDLAGVISVDSANWHFAGTSGVPILGIMNQTPHWFWGHNAQVEDTYPSAETINKGDLTPKHIADWITSTRTDWEARKVPAPVVHSKPTGFDTPLFIVSLPRSRSSMIARVFAHHGVWFGQTVAGNANNPHGYYENTRMRETYLKGILRELGADPLGVKPLPRLFPQPPFPHLPGQLAKVLTAQDYQAGPWGFKDPKLTLVWPIFARAFPKARWLILERDRDAVIRSLCRTSFMKRHSTSPEFWRMFCIAYQSRLDALKAAVPNVQVIDTDAVAAGDYSDFEDPLSSLGLTYSLQDTRSAIDFTRL